MATLKDIQRKIGAVKKTQKITKAMNMVAASRLRGAQQKMEAFRPYANKFAEVLGSLAERIEADEEHAPPLLVPRTEVKTIDLVLMTSDRGLCGSFNTNLIAHAERFLKEKADQGIEVRLICMGRKGRDYFRRRKYNILSEHIGIVGAKFGFNIAVNVGRSLIDGFLSGEFDEAHMLFSEFVSMARQAPTVKQLLPITSVEKAEEAQKAEDVGYIAEHICEPPAEELMAEMLPKQVYVQIFRGLLETSTSEHAARMQAMDNATNNCKEMITSLTLVYNKARQAAITAELMDIVGGAEALKG
ncbi:MAG: ATP synthase F1 subunit gamma [Deltaproteobacteria bacterium]|nr:ATP synthase F1 subunit gamma [Deltaproteobacteria bacterium]MBW2019676.1 ATP synthase F1 subunit gamma [Deltaproteobacteria bacterium]MBW2074456.1 ATP synthase F1 subunit gamma [Deltaproteobacteria bacterium]